MTTIERNHINSLSGLLIRIYRNFVVYTDSTNSEVKNLHFTQKREGDNKGQWGYYINEDIGTIAEFMSVNKFKKIIDLGAGAGILVHVLRALSFQAHGYEIEDTLIEISNKINSDVVILKKDILTLIKKDIKDYECIYFWEPFCSEELSKKFIKNLTNIMKKNQHILYKPASPYLIRLLENDKKMESLPNFG